MATFINTVDGKLQVEIAPGSPQTYLPNTGQGLKDELSEIKETITTYRGQPVIVTLAEDMTDELLIYLYMGTEEGYEANHWYYYDTENETWTDGGAYVANPVVIDDTLTQAGEAADAKKVGDEISEIKSDLQQKSVGVLENNGFKMLWSKAPENKYFDASTTSFKTSANQSRACVTEVVKVDKQMALSASTGYQLIVFYFASTDPTSYSSNTGWKTSVTVNVGEYITVVVRKSDDSAISATDFWKIYYKIFLSYEEYQTEDLVGQIDAVYGNDPFRTLWSGNPEYKFFHTSQLVFKSSADHSRSCVAEVVKVNRDMTISVKPGYQMFIYYFSSASTSNYTSNSGWTADDVVLHKGEYINVCVRKPDDSAIAQDAIWNVYSRIYLSYDEYSSALCRSDDGISAVVQAKRRYNTSAGSYRNRTPLLTLLHFSDIHEDSANLERIIRVRDTLPDYINDAICTGDMVTKYADGMTWWNNVTGSDTILTCIGNHELQDSNSGYQEYGDPHTMADVYGAFMAPYIADWGVTYESGKTYYYKDYTDNKIRLIVLDSMVRDDADLISAQNTWLATALSGAATLGYSVVIATHFSQRENQVKIDSNFTMIDSAPVSGTLLTTYLDTVQNFIDNDGDFICWLSGHEHIDSIVYSSDYPSQIIICVGEAKCEEYYGDVQRQKGYRSQDLFNVVSFDVDKQIIKIVRIGADRDCYMRHRGTLTMKWSDKSIVNYD